MAKLRAEDWSTPILDVNELIEGEEEGVAIADVRRAIAAIAGEGKKKKKGSRAIVVLGAAPGLDRKTAEETTVVVTRGRQIEAVAAWVVQLGDENVRQRRVLRSVPMPVCEERKVSVRIPKSQTTNAQWEEAARDLRGYLRKHAAETGAGSISITGVETRGRFDDPTRFFGALVRTTEEGAAALAKASGRNGVFAAPKGDEGPVVWLSTGTKLEEAQAFARDRPGLVIRLAVNKKGLGLRVKTEDEDRARKEAAGAAVPKQQGRLYDVSGFDRGTTAGQAELFLRTAGWADATIIRAIPKRGGILAVVRGQDPPTWEFGVEGAKARILVSTTRYRTETDQRWVQAIAQERRKDPGERGTAREDESYTWKEFVQHYGMKQAEKEWSNAGREKEAASGVVPIEQQPAAAGVQNGKGAKGDKGLKDASSPISETYAQAAASGKKGNAEGKRGKQKKPQEGEEVEHQLEQLRGENQRLNAKLERAAKAAEEERGATREVVEQNKLLSRKVEELTTLLGSLQEQVQASNKRYWEAMVGEELAPYIARMRLNGTYGDEVTLCAAAEVLRCSIWVINAERRGVIQRWTTEGAERTVVVTYLPQHYDSVQLPHASLRKLEQAEQNTLPLNDLFIGQGRARRSESNGRAVKIPVSAAPPARIQGRRVAEAKAEETSRSQDDDLIIVTINVTSLDTEKLLVVALLKADIVVLQETRVTKVEKAYMSSFLAAYGWNVHWGDDVTMVEGRDGRWQRRPGGVAVMTRQHLAAQRVAAVEESEKRVVASTRVVHVAVALGDGRTALHIFSLYGQSGNSVQVQREREQLVSEVLGVAAGLGQVPTLVVGDYNCTTETSSVLAAACRSGRWADAAAAYAVGQGEEPPCTCWAPNTTGGSRIDLCLANACAAPAISKVFTVERKDSEFYTHAPMYVTIRQQAFRERHRRAILPAAFPRAYPKLNQEEKSGLEVFAREAQEALTGAMSLKELSQQAEGYLLMLHRHELALPSRAYTGRGNQAVSDSRLASKFQHSSTRGASTKQTRARDELLGHLRTLVQAGRERLSAGIPYPLTRREENARDAARKRVGRGYIPEAVANIVMTADLSELQALQSALADLEGSQKAAFTALRRHRKTQWTHKMQEAWAHGRGLVFDYIADRYSSPLTFLQREDKTLTANAAEIDEILRGEKAWGGIFQRYATQEEPCWGRFLRMYSPVLPDRAEMECESITVGEVRAALAKMKKSASAGMHGWRIHELQQLPNSLLEGFARVLNEVEESGEWPEELMHALVSLIPKPKSTGDPLSQRPISVAPVLYRIWAAIRAKNAQSWMDELAPEGLHGCRPGHSTEDLFWHLAAEIEEAHLMGRPLHGIAFDFKKCFDSVPIDITLRLAKRLGFNRKVLRALKAAYRQMQRHFKVNGTVGVGFIPTNGIMQGCAISVILIGLLISVWMRHVAQEGCPRSYVDDVTATAREANHLQTIANKTAIMSALWTGPSRRAVEMVMQVLHHGHRLDPVTAPAYIRIRTWVRQMQKWRHIRALAEVAWTRRETLPAGSPHRLMQDSLSQAEWVWTTPEVIGYTSEIGQQVVFHASNASEKQTAIMLHDLRQALRRRQMRNMCNRREDLRGCEHGQWKHGGELWNAMHWWLNRLRWAHVESEHTVTFVELAIDFEVTTGVRLPEVANRRIQPPTASAAKATTARAVLPLRETTAGLCVYFDGGSRQNGTALAVAGAGAVLYKDGIKLAEATVPLGRTTNNVAEYNGLIAGIRLLGEQPRDVGGPVKIRGDSQVVIGPVNGTAICKPNLRPYFLQAKASMVDLSPRFEFSLEHVPRKKNVDADALSNAAMDMAQAGTGAQVGVIRAQYDEFKSSALAKGQSFRAVTSAVARICGVAWHCGHVSNVTSVTALGGGVMLGLSCRAELAAQTETVLRAMSQPRPGIATTTLANPASEECDGKMHEACCTPLHRV
ncbi:Ribonuclease HI [Diplonema papillatum]|nr:Ribonuclease HI [Diplonema papillatum]